MRILIGIQNLWQGGGTESHTITLANELRKLGHDVSLYTSGGPWVKRARDLGIQVHVDTSAEKTPTQFSREIYVKRLLRRQYFDVLHAQDAPCLRIFTQAAAGMTKRPKVIFTVHGHYVRPFVLLHAKNKANAIIAVSSNIRSSLLKSIPRDKVHTVSNGIRADVFRSAPGHTFRRTHGISSNAFVIGYSARFTFDKVELGKRVVRALSHYASRKPNVHLLVAGRGSKSMISPSKRVHVLGHIELMPAFLNACDAVVATGRMAMEASFCEVNVVALGKAGYHGIVTAQNINHMIRTNFGDHGASKVWTEASLSSALSKIQTHQTTYRSQTKSLRQIMLQRLSATQMANQTLMIYRKA